MIIRETENLLLRDFCKEDIEKRVVWEIEDYQWQEWDAPWEEKLSDEEKNEFTNGLRKLADRISQKRDDEIRYSFQIVIKQTGEYIGWVNCYFLDDNYNYSDNGKMYTLGIDIPPQSCRGKGYGYEAFLEAVNYFAEQGIDEIYTQTWSGNERMIHLAKKLGFTEIDRKKDLRLVNGKKYDGLTFVRRRNGN